MVLPSFLPLPPFSPCFAINVCPCPCPLCCHDTKWQLRGQGQGQILMAKHGGNGGKGKNNTTEDRAKSITPIKSKNNSMRIHRLSAVWSVKWTQQCFMFSSGELKMETYIYIQKKKLQFKTMHKGAFQLIGHSGLVLVFKEYDKLLGVTQIRQHEDGKVWYIYGKNLL